MTLNEAKEIFGFEDTVGDIKKRYKELVFKFHPDSHPDNSKEYEEKIKLINEAYSILEHNIVSVEYMNTKTERDIYEKNKQIRKEQILTDIVVKSYYQSQEKINQLRFGMLDLCINGVAKINLKRTRTIEPILRPICIDMASKETNIINSFIKQNVQEFMEQYNLDTGNSDCSFILFVEPLYFLDLIPDWYEQILTVENTIRISKK